MESGKQVHCWIVRTADTGAVATREHAGAPRIADPFIADLITKLQAEVRRERRSAAVGRARYASLDRLARRRGVEHAEAELTWSGSPLYFTEADFDAWERRALPSRQR